MAPYAQAAIKKRPRVAQTRRSTPTPKPSNIDVLVAQLADNSIEDGDNLADACRQASFKNLAIALNMNAKLLTEPRGEFETAEEYQGRASKIAGALNVRQMIMCQPLDDNEDAPFQYNADEEAFAGSFSKRQNVWRDVKQLGSYRSKTRMGIAATVKSSLEMEYNAELDLPATVKGCVESSYASDYRFRVPVPRDRAPTVKASGYLVYIGKLVAPFVSSSERSGNPTLDDPYDIYRSEITAYLDPERVVVVDGDGTEIWTCRPGFYYPNQAAKPVGNAETWIRSYDYPYFTYGETKAGGTVGVSLTVSPSGTAQSCKVVRSSGNARLDEATCRALVREARFTPASDQNGAPVTGEWLMSHTWSPQ
jgi:TonB family protein